LVILGMILNVGDKVPHVQNHPSTEQRHHSSIKQCRNSGLTRRKVRL
jgi:hypothetical protein